jgi:predicted Zn-dependent protease
MVFDMGPSKGARSALEYLRHVWAARSRLHDVERLVIDGHQAATGWTEGRGEAGPVHIRALAIRRDRESFYRFMYISPRNQAERWARPFRRSGQSFRRISPDAAARVRAQRLLVVPARSDDSIAGLARTLPYGRHNESWFRVLNDLAPNQPIGEKQRLKVVAG